MGAWCARVQLAETWWIWRLASSSSVERKQAFDALREMQSIRGVPFVFETGRDHPELWPATIDYIAAVASELPPEYQVQVVERLIEIANAPDVPPPLGTDPVPSGWSIPAPDVLERLGPRLESAFPIFASALADPKSPIFRACARALAAAWPRSRAVLEPQLAQLPFSTLLAIVTAQTGENSLQDWILASVTRDPAEAAMPLPSSPLSLAGNFVAHRRAALALAIAAVSKGAFLEASLLGPSLEAAVPLEERRAAIRLVGALGDRPDAPDLVRALLDEPIDSPAFLDLLEARSLWVRSPEEGLMRLDLGSGILCGWSSTMTRRGKRSRLTPPEIQKLEGILDTSRIAVLRDAASQLLADNVRDDHDAVPIEPGLIVHEWGVWKDSGGVVRGPESTLDDLPPFVHRSTVAPSALAIAPVQIPLSRPTIVRKPVVYFRSARPLTVNMRVHFFGGRPWSHYPLPSDYAIAPRVAAQRGALPPTELEDADSTAPPWKLEGPVEVNRGGPSWARLPLPQEIAIPLGLGGLGLEWRGLRVGWPESVEASLEPVAESSWWRHLREVPARDVSIGGERERFVYYDGAVKVPGPIIPEWTAESRSKLRLHVSFAGSYPGSDWLPWRARNGLELMHGESKVFSNYVLPAAFVIRVSDTGLARGAVRRNLSSKADPVTLDVGGLPLAADELMRAFQGELVSGGLDESEAASLIAVFGSEFFKKPGLRLLTFLPSSITSGVLPLELEPWPEELVRVAVVWRECEDLPIVDEHTYTYPGFRAFGVETREHVLALEREPLHLSDREQLELQSNGTLTLELPYDSAWCLASDGRHAAVSYSLASGKEELALLELETRTISRLGPVESLHFAFLPQPALSADGRRVAFELLPNGSPIGSDLLDAPSELWVADVVERWQTKLTNDAKSSPALSSDGTTVAWSTRTALHIVRLETGREVVHEIKTRPAHLDLSRDGSRLVFQTTSASGLSAVQVLDVEKRQVIDVSGEVGDNSFPAISGDGRVVVFQTNRDRDDEIFVADLEDGGLSNLSRDTDEDHAPVLDLQGRRVLWGRMGGLILVDRDTGQQRRLPANAYRGEISEDGTRVLLEENRDGKSALRWIEVAPDDRED